jgi:hypothetical protein
VPPLNGRLLLIQQLPQQQVAKVWKNKNVKTRLLRAGDHFPESVLVGVATAGFLLHYEHAGDETSFDRMLFLVGDGYAPSVKKMMILLENA